MDRSLRRDAFYLSGRMHVIRLKLWIIDFFQNSGRILSRRTHACYTDASIVTGRASIPAWYALNTAVLVLVLMDRKLLCQSQRRLLDCLSCNEGVKETFYCEESCTNLQAVGGYNY